jgi:tetratricopeptide (TPR) repeat protein
MQAQALVQRGLIAEALERGAVARTSYEQAEYLFEKSHDGEGAIDARIRLGSVLVRQGELDAGLALLQQAYQDAQQQSLLALQMAALPGIGQAQLELEHSDAARRAFEEGLTIAHGLQQLKQEALFSVRLAQLHQSSQDTERRQLAQHALMLYQAVRDRLGEADSLSLLGTLYLNDKDEDKALTHHQRALELYRALRHRAREAGSLMNLGIVYESQGLTPLAYETYGKAISLLQSLPASSFSPMSRF